MSSREPVWFCHQCREEMRPDMVPDPQCPLCRSTFVEKIENTDDDPRQFQQNIPADFDSASLPPEIDTFLLGLRQIMDHSTRFPRSPSADANADASNPQRFRFQLRPRPISGSRSLTIGGPNTTAFGSSGNDVPSMSQFQRENLQQPAMGITGPRMAQYLSALLSMRGGDPFVAGPQSRWGDYAFTQDALDQIITQLMENSTSGRPVPAPEDIISDLPREVLETGSPTLEKECAVCKDQFQLETEDPGEQVVVKLPCTHCFHEGCILPWLKSSGTCPVCRHALVPQPEYHAPRPGPMRPPNGAEPSGRPNQDADSLFDAIFGGPDPFNSPSASSSNGGSSNGSSNFERNPRSRRSHDHPRFPGSWGE